MDKREAMIEYLSDNLFLMINSDNVSYYTYGEIPGACISGAIRKYAPVSPDDILALIDTTILGGGGQGMVFTEEGVWIKEMFSPPVFRDYWGFGDEAYINSVDYSLSGFEMIMSGMFDIIGRCMMENLEEMNEALDEASENLENAIKQIHEEEIEKIYDIQCEIDTLNETFSEYNNKYLDTEDLDKIYEYIGFNVISIYAIVNVNYLIEGMENAGMSEIELDELEEEALSSIQETHELFNDIDKVFREYKNNGFDINIPHLVHFFEKSANYIYNITNSDDEDISLLEKYTYIKDEVEKICNKLNIVSKHCDIIINYLESI